MSMLKEFKEFAMKGNVVDLAVWVVIGGAFGKIVTSLVEDLIMPPIGWLIGNVDFTDLVIKLPALIEGQAEVTVKYGNFLTILINFLIVALAIFFVIVKPMSKMKKKEEKVEEAVVASLSKDQELLTEIRDLLKKNR
jgi:large conductance mechanosensitive channel